MSQLKELVLTHFEKLILVPEELAANKPAPDKWSIKEIIGHLIDSASNNHHRFVKGQLTEKLVFDNYAQDDWVRIQRYQEMNWHELLILWRSFNLHLAQIIEATSEAPRYEHVLIQKNVQTQEESDPMTLDYLMEDYVTHLMHHLGQVEVLLS